MTPKRLGFKAVDVHFGTFDFTVHCIVGPFKNVERYARWKLDEPEIVLTGNPRGLHISRPGWVPIVWMPRKPRTAREHGTFAHEMLHAIRHMLVDWAGMSLTKETDEVFCHALGHAVTEVLEAL